MVLLHACCHNPTGFDLSQDDWLRVLDIVRSRELLPLFDFAYQGFGDGLREDAVGLEALLRPGAELLVASSFSKNFALYDERVGALSLVCATKEEASALLSHAKAAVRANYSNPPAHGGEVVATILADAERLAAIEVRDNGKLMAEMLGQVKYLAQWYYYFGGLADIAVVKANQLMPKPAHLTWEEAAVNALCNSTSYRMLVGRNGAHMKQGDVVLIWGATGGIGAYATQYVLNGGGIPVCVVSSADKADILRRMGVEHIIDRAAAGYRFWKDEHTHDESEWRRLGKDIRDLCGEDPDIVFEHPGRSTFAASMYVAKRGGTVVTCAATSGFTATKGTRPMSR